MYQTILVPIDGSLAASAGLDEAIRIARQVGARLHLMNIVDDMAFRQGEAGDDSDSEATLAAGELRSVVIEGGEKVLRRAKARAEEAGVAADVVLVRSGNERLRTLVAREAEASRADLIVLGTHARRGLSRVFMDTDAEHLLSVVMVPVLLVRSEAVGPDLSVVEISASDSMFLPMP